MELFDRITKDRYKYPNTFSSIKFIDFMITELDGSEAFDESLLPNEIVKMVRNVFGYTRYEPLNPYVFHKCVPAARNIHANEAYIIWNGNVVRYNCRKNIFEKVRYDESVKDQRRLVIVGEPWRIMKFYGEFGMVLPLLDGGHLLAEIKLNLSEALVKKLIVELGAGIEGIHSALGISENSNVVVLGVDFSKAFPGREDPKIVSDHRRISCYDAEVARYEISKAFFEPETGFEKFKAMNETGNVCRFEKKDKRESAHNYVGICSVSETVDNSFVDKLTEQYLNVLEKFHVYKERFLVRIVYSTVQGTRMRTVQKGLVSDDKEISLEKRKLLHDTARMIDMDSMPLIAYFSYIYDEKLTEKENIYLSHVGAAEMNHYLSILAPQYGFFSRPMRNFEDDYVEGILGKEPNERYMYSLIMGKANTSNYVMRLNRERKAN